MSAGAKICAVWRGTAVAPQEGQSGLVSTKRYRPIGVAKTGWIALTGDGNVVPCGVRTDL